MKKLFACLALIPALAFASEYEEFSPEELMCAVAVAPAAQAISVVESGGSRMDALYAVNGSVAYDPELWSVLVDAEHYHRTTNKPMNSFVDVLYLYCLDQVREELK